ncbi:aldehyde dehydrogenase family protein [Arthrobacter sp. K5]|uniref:Aldehyde dehydrogenase family protein n=1 Tax=Arthrobacter sp. K5 TaxID=2839623 RepID=A0AAU8EX02_9MICC
MSETRDHWTNGESVAPANSSYAQGTNPATGEAGVGVAQGTRHDLAAPVEAAEDAASAWWHYPSAQRGRLLQSLAQEMRRRNKELASPEIEDTGKPMAVALSEVRTLRPTSNSTPVCSTTLAVTCWMSIPSNTSKAAGTVWPHRWLPKCCVPLQSLSPAADEGGFTVSSDFVLRVASPTVSLSSVNR